MTAFFWEEGPLGKHHDRTTFDCGKDTLNTYLIRYARQNHESGGAKYFIATPRSEPARILGFYTLSPASIEFSRARLPSSRAGSGAMRFPSIASVVSLSITASKAVGSADGFCCAPPNAA